MVTLPGILVERCRETLLKSDKFDTDQKLQTVFVIQQELAPYRDELPEADSRGDRVDKVIAFLLHKDSIGEQAVFLKFLRALLHHTSKEEYLFTELWQLCIEVESVYFVAQSRQEPLDHSLEVTEDGSIGWYTSNTQKQNQIMASHLFQARKTQSLPLQYHKRIKIDKDVIVSYDLDSQMAKFRERLGYEGAFSFAISGNMTILEQYIIERMMRELRSKTGRPCIRFSVRVYPDDLLPGISAIERKLVASQICDSLPRWFDDNPDVDIVLIVWNYEIPPVAMKLVASSFWEAIKSQVMPCLRNQSRCFVVIWANIGNRKYIIEQSTIISAPAKFAVSELEQWFRGQLRQLGIEENVIQQYLLRLKNQHGHLIGTFQEMQGIIHELQGGITFYG